MSQSSSARVVRLPRLEVPYPPVNHFIAESPEILKLWEHPMETNPLGDSRLNDGKAFPTHLLDPSKLKYVVGPTENLIFVDEESGEVFGSVYHGLVSDAAMLKALNGTVTDHLNKVKKSLRDNDPGYLVGVGYTAGSRSNRSLDWVKNLINTATRDDRRQQAYKMSSLFAYIWGLAKQVLPKAVIDDFNKAIVELDGLKMDGGVRGQGEGILRYNIIVDGEERSFESSEMAPPAGLCGMNYSRYVHNEKNQNDFCIKFTTSRTHGQEYGASFFIAAYGIHIPTREDQLATWRGADLHGTALALNEPFDTSPPFNHIGIAFILATGIKSELEKEKRLGRTTMSEDFDPAQGLVSLAILDDANVEPKQRPSMIKRKVQSTKTVYKKDVKETFALPPNHTYSGWTKRRLVEECERRSRAGTLKHFGNSWQVSKLMAILLRNDGFDIKMTSALPAKKGGDVAGAPDEDEEDEVEEED